MRRYRIAAILMIIHGGLMELSGSLAFLSALGMKGDAGTNQFVSFIVPYLNDNLPMMMVMGAIFGIVRIIGAVGVLRNRMWGLALSVINCVLTMALMIFMLPAGIMDGLLACTALVLLLTQYFGRRKIME